MTASNDIWIFLLLSVSTLAVGNVEKNGDRIIKWKPVKSLTDAIDIRPEPAGMENGRVLYLCRGKLKHKDDFHAKPGKLVARDGILYCSVAHKKELLLQKFEMLDVPAGILSWEKSTGVLSSNVLLGGNSKSGINYFICRATDKGNVVVGYIRRDDKFCNIIKDNLEYGIKDNVEILVVNAYGEMLIEMPVDNHPIRDADLLHIVE